MKNSRFNWMFGLLVCVLLLASSGPASSEEQAPLYEGRDAASWGQHLVPGTLDERRKAVYALWQLGPEARSEVRLLACALRDADEYVRKTADKVLARFQWLRSLNTLSTALPELILALEDERLAVQLAAVNLIWMAGPQPNMAGGEPPPKELVPALLKALDARHADLRANAAASLANLQKTAAPALPRLTVALEDEDPKVRLWAIRALSWIDPKATFASVLARAGDKDEGVRIAVFEAAMGAPPAFAAEALKALTLGTGDKVTKVRLAAVNGLWGRQDVLALPALIRVLESGDEPSIRSAAARGLGGLGDPSAVPVLLKVLIGQDDAVDLAAAAGLSALGPEGAAAALPMMLLLFEAGAPARKVSLARAISQMAPFARSALLTLRRALSHEEGNVRSMAASALSGLAAAGVFDEKTLAAVIESMDDSEPDVRGYAVAVLFHLGPAAVSAVPALMKRFEREDAALDWRPLFSALGAVGPGAEAALPLLRPFVAKASEDQVPAAGAVALIASEAKEIDAAVQVLIDAMAEESKRFDALHQLKAAGPRAKRAALIMRVWMKSDTTWRMAAAGALLNMEGEQAQDALGFLISELEGDNASWAARLLGEAGVKARGATPALLKLASDEASTSRFAALRALLRVKARGPEVRHAYERARQDKRAFLRTMGARGLAALAADEDG